ncbi:hypothetical protein ENBRE01_0680 [Enteropsectra breve]|nr:hypothetical protein ENBRE01_0680 [Enteropsectra breve]
MFGLVSSVLPLLVSNILAGKANEKCRFIEAYSETGFNLTGCSEVVKQRFSISTETINSSGCCGRNVCCPYLIPLYDCTRFDKESIKGHPNSYIAYMFDMLGFINTTLGFTPKNICDFSGNNATFSDDAAIRSFVTNLVDNNCYSNFDAANPVVYNVNIRANLARDTFDLDFINWYLPRLNIFLFYATSDKVECGFEDSGNVFVEKIKCGNVYNSVVINFLNLPIDNYNCISESAALKIINFIVTNGIVRHTIINFNKCLLHQLESIACKCSSRGDSTSSIYIKTLKECIIRVNALMNENFEIKYRFLKNQARFSFLAMPSIYSDSAATPTPIVNKPTYIFANVPTEKVPLSHLVDYIE